MPGFGSARKHLTGGVVRGGYTIGKPWEPFTASNTGPDSAASPSSPFHHSNGAFREMSSTGFFDLPTELHEEILSYLPFGDPPTLQGLQLGLTCKALYKILGPAIVKIQVGRLLEAIDLQLCSLEPSPNMSAFQAVPQEFRSNDYESNWRTIHSTSIQQDTINRAFYPSKNPHSEGDFGITYSVMSKGRGPSAVEEIWCLHSLIWRSQHLGLRRISLRLHCPEEEENVGREWTRAFLKLLEVCAEQPGIEITVTDPSSVYGSARFKPLARLFVREETVHEPSTVLSSISSSLQRFGRKSSSADINTTQPALLYPTDFVFSPQDFVTSRLSLLRLSGRGVFNHLHYPFLHHLALQSSSTLTRLHLNLGSHLSDDWRAMLSWWRFPRLSHFSIRESMVPLDVLISFLQCHPTLTNVSLWVHYIHDGSTVPPLNETQEDFLPNVCQMVASPSLLIHILSSSALSSSGFTLGKTVELLSSVERLTISQEHDYLRGSNTALNFQDISRVLSLVAVRRYNTNLMPRLHTLSIRTVYQAPQAFQEWIRGVIGQGTASADSRSPSSHSASSSLSSNAATTKNVSSPILNLPLCGIPEFHVSAYSSPYYDEELRNCMVPTMSVDPNLVVDFIVHLFHGHNAGGSEAGGLNRVVLSDIFTGCSRGSKNWREVDTIPLAVERIWERCRDLEEVRCLGFGRYDLSVEKVWKRPTELP